MLTQWWVVFSSCLTQHREPSCPALPLPHSVDGRTHVSTRVTFLCRTDDKLPIQLLQRKHNADRMWKSHRIYIYIYIYVHLKLVTWDHKLISRGHTTKRPDDFPSDFFVEPGVTPCWKCKSMHFLDLKAKLICTDLLSQANLCKCIYREFIVWLFSSFFNTMVIFSEWIQSSTMLLSMQTVLP